MDLASVVAALASVGARVSSSAPNSSVRVNSSRACPPGLAGPEPSGTIHDLGQHFQILRSLYRLYVLEIVLLLVPRLKILRGLSIWDLGFRVLRNKEAQEYNSSSQETNHNKSPEIPQCPGVNGDSLYSYE